MKIKIALLVSCFIVWTFAIASASASAAYLHEANAQNYAKAHAWNTFCEGLTRCTKYPWIISTRRVSNTDVRTRVGAQHRVYGNCARTFEVIGDDSAPRITSGSDPYWSCPF